MTAPEKNLNDIPRTGVWHAIFFGKALASNIHTALKRDKPAGVLLLTKKSAMIEPLARLGLTVPEEADLFPTGSPLQKSCPVLCRRFDCILTDREPAQMAACLASIGFPHDSTIRTRDQDKRERTMIYETILFDLDGTLTESDPGIIHAVLYAMERMGLTPPSQERLRRFVGPPLTVSFQDVYQLGEDDCRRAVALYQEYYHDRGWQENRVYPGIPALLERLRQAGKTLLVATAKPDDSARQVLSHFGLADYFHGIQGAMEYEAHCQKAAVIRMALANCPHREPVVMVGDRENDCRGAAENGIPAIGVLYGYGDRAELEAAGAAAIAESVEDLGRVLLEGTL